MRKLTVNLKILAGFLVAFAVIGYFLFVSYRNDEISNEEFINSGYQNAIISSAEEILDNMQDIETGYRGFIISSNEEYLVPCYSALERSADDLNRFRKLTDDDPEVQNNVRSLIELVNQKIYFAGKIIDLCKEGRNAEANLMIRTGNGKRMMDNIRTIVSRLENNARSELNRFATKRQELAREQRNNFLLLTIIIFVILIIFWIIISSDLKKGERSKTELEYAADKIRDLYDHAPSGYITCDRDLKITQLNKTVLIWLGYEHEELANKKHLNVLVSDGYSLSLNKLKENDTVSNLELRLEGKNKTIDVILEAVTRRDPMGKIIDKRFVLTDISQRKKAEDTSRYLASLIDQTSDAIYSSDKGFIIRSWNKGAEKMYGYTAEEAIDRNSSLLRSSMTPEERVKIISELEKNGSWGGEFIHHKKDGTPFPVYTSITAITEQNKVTGYVSVVKDITSQKLYEEQLKNFNQELLEKVAQKSEEVYNTLERISDGFVALDKDFRITYVNSIGAQTFGMERSELIGKDLRTTFGTEDNSFRQAYIRAFETQTRIEMEDYSAHFKRWYYTVMYPGTEGISIYFKDVTDRKIYETRLKESEKQYRKLFENNPLPMWVLDIETLVIWDVNLAAVKHYGYTLEEFVGKSALDLRPDTDKQRFLKHNVSRRPGQENAGIWTHLKKDGTEIQVEILSYDTSFDGRPCRLIIAQDITEKLKSADELLQSRDQLRKLSVHLEEVREEERASISRDLHDELGQQLTGLKMDISWISKKIDAKNKELNERIQKMIGLVDETVKSVRRIASELRPGVLDDLGLTAALDWQTHEFRNRTGIDCKFKSDVNTEIVDNSISIGVFRIMQEALTNVARHSNATEVMCTLTGDNKEIRLTIGDNGSGIQQANVRKNSLGLLGMRERARMMNGMLAIRSEPGKGTNVELIVPLNGNGNS